jgi:hypothetical protein
VKLSLCSTKHYAIKTWGGADVIHAHFLDLCNSWWIVSFTPRPLYSVKDPRYSFERKILDPTPTVMKYVFQGSRRLRPFRRTWTNSGDQCLLSAQMSNLLHSRASNGLPNNNQVHCQGNVVKISLIWELMYIVSNIFCLFYSTTFSVAKMVQRRITNWKRHGRKLPWSILRLHPGRNAEGNRRQPPDFRAKILTLSLSNTEQKC